MAHKIEKNDTVFTISKAWHGLEKIVDRIEGFGFEVKAVPLYLDADSGPIATHKAIVDDSGALISVAKSSYEIITNQSIFDSASAAVGEVEGARIVSAGSVKGRKVVFATVELDGLKDFNAGGDAHTAKLNLISSHDGTKAFTARFGFTRIVCANTVQMAESEAKSSLTLYHTKNSARQIKGMKETVAELVRASEFYKEQAERLRSETCNEEQARNFLAAFLAPVGASELSTRAANQVDEIAALFAKGKGNSGETRWDLFNGITEYFTHEASDDKGKLFESSEFGTYADKKTEAMGELTALSATWKATQKKGRDLLATV